MNFAFSAPSHSPAVAFKI